MFERYTERARRVVFFARYEASQYGSVNIESEHLLLGLIREDKSLINRFLQNFEVSSSIRQEIEGRMEIRPRISTELDLPLSQACKNILASASQEMEQMKSPHLGTEHLLLGMLKESGSVVFDVLTSRGLSVESVRQRIAPKGTDSAADIRIEPDPLSTMHLRLNNLLLVATLSQHGFNTARNCLMKAAAAKNADDFQTARSELQLFLESLVDEIKDRRKGADVTFPIFEGFDWKMSMRGLRSGLSDEEDWRFRWWLTMLLAEVLVQRFEQDLNS